MLASRRWARPLPGIDVPADAALLVLAANAPLQMRGPQLQCAPLPDALPRMLAFHDHALGIERPPPEDPRQPAWLLVPQGPWNEMSCRDWLLPQIIAASPTFERCAALWARSERYQIVRFVLAHPELSVQQLAARYGLSCAQFRRVCLRAFGRPLKEQLRLVRATRALQLHADTGISFTQVATETGFSSPSHFCCEIKSLLGRSPRDIFGSPRRS
ncbi:helix-turn-helix domain-containing protein [Stenotrophomonas sp. NPDC077659]|uniref:helix-turn-helix domain-containing protein n=1 Tax=Stenotrophomonas sp. NPDC077659 TaxID=3390694 RepID=UPI003D00CA7A